jgi:hypothetical protein
MDEVMFQVSRLVKRVKSRKFKEAHGGKQVGVAKTRACVKDDGSRDGGTHLLRHRTAAFLSSSLLLIAVVSLQPVILASA